MYTGMYFKGLPVETVLVTCFTHIVYYTVYTKEILECSVCYTPCNLQLLCQVYFAQLNIAQSTL